MPGAVPFADSSTVPASGQETCPTGRYRPRQYPHQADAPRDMLRSEPRLELPPNVATLQETAASLAAPGEPWVRPYRLRFSPGPAGTRNEEELTEIPEPGAWPRRVRGSARHAGKELLGKGTGLTGCSVRAPVSPPGRSLRSTSACRGLGRKKR